VHNHTRNGILEAAALTSLIEADETASFGRRGNILNDSITYAARERCQSAHMSVSIGFFQTANMMEEERGFTYAHGRGTAGRLQSSEYQQHGKVGREAETNVGNNVGGE
jgi:hypothetical protein